MKAKHSILMIFVLFFPLILSSCKGATSASPSTSPQSLETNSSSQDGLPPLEDTFKTLYQGADEMYTKIVFGNFHCDVNQPITKGDLTYYKVDEPAFDSYDAFIEHLSKYFTEDFINNTILTPDQSRFIKGEDGALYLLDAGRGSNILYAGHVFHSIQQTENEVTFTATAYYAKAQEAYEGDPFFTTPKNINDFTTEEYTFVLVKENSAWKFDQFSCFF